MFKLENLYNMKQNIEELVADSIEKASEQFEGDKTIQQFEESLEAFEKMVKMGLTKERGNNLMSISDINQTQVIFNANSRSVTSID